MPISACSTWVFDTFCLRRQALCFACLTPIEKKVGRNAASIAGTHCFETKTERCSDTSVRLCLGFHSCLLFPRICGEVVAICNDSRAGSLVSHDGIGHQRDSGRLLLHILVRKPDRWGGSGPFRGKTHDSCRSRGSRN